MASQLASLQIAVQTRDLRKASDELKKLQREGLKAEKGTDKLTNSTKKLGSSLSSLPALFSAVIVSMGIAKVIKYADAMTLVDSRLKLATNSTEEFTTAQTELFAISQKTRTQFTSTVDLYERVARSTRDYNIEQSELLALTETINKSMIISGGTAESMNAAIIQLGQAFSADFQAVGQELASIREQTPRLYQALLEGTGKSSKAFKKLAEEGGLSTKMIIDALRSQGVAVADEFGIINVTVDQSMTVVENSLARGIGALDKAIGFTNILSKAFLSVAESIDKATKSSEESTVAEKKRQEFGLIKALTEANRELDVYSNRLDQTTKIEETFFDKTFGTKKVDSIKNINDDITAQKTLIKDLIAEYNKLFGTIAGKKKKKKKKDYSEFDSDLSVFDMDKGEISEGVDFAMAQNKKLYDDKIALQKRANKQWHDDEIAEAKATEKLASNTWDNIGDIAKSNISGALQAGMDGNLDLSAFTSQLSKAVGQSLLFSGGMGSVAGVGLMALGSVLGGATVDSNKTAADEADKNFTKFIEGLNKATSSLEAFGLLSDSMSQQIKAVEDEMDAQKASFISQTIASGRTSERAEKDWLSSLANPEFFGSTQASLFKLLQEELATFTQEINVQTASLTNELEILKELDPIKKLELERQQELNSIYSDNTAIQEAIWAEEDRQKATLKMTEAQIATTRKVNQETLGSLSFMNEVEKLSFANNLYQNAITQEDRVSSSRTIAQLSQGQTRTREEYVPIFAQYLNELQKQGEEATLSDVVNELVVVGEKIDNSADTQADAAKYA